MRRRLEDKIRSLIAQLVDAKDDETQLHKLQELREALHEYMAKLRGNLSRYPFVKQQRALNGIPPPNVRGKKVGPAPSTRVSEPKGTANTRQPEIPQSKGDIPA